MVEFHVTEQNIMFIIFFYVIPSSLDAVELVPVGVLHKIVQIVSAEEPKTRGNSFFMSNLPCLKYSRETEKVKLGFFPFTLCALKSKQLVLHR